MDVNLSTIGSMFSPPSARSAPASRPEAPLNDDRFSPSGGHPNPATDATLPTTPPHAASEAPDRPAAEAQTDFKETLRKQTETDNSSKTSDKQETAKQSAESKIPDQSDAGQAAHSQILAAVQNKLGNTPISEPNTPQQPVRPVAGVKTQINGPPSAKTAAPTPTGHAGVATPQQQGSETALQVAVGNVSAATAVGKRTRNADLQPASAGVTVQTKSTDKASGAVQVELPHPPGVNAEKPANADKEAAPVESSTTAAPTKTPAARTKQWADQPAGQEAIKQANLAENVKATVASSRAASKSNASAGATRAVSTEAPASDGNKVSPAMDGLPDAPEKTSLSVGMSSAVSARPAQAKAAGTGAKNLARDGNDLRQPVAEPPLVSVQSGPGFSMLDSGSSILASIEHRVPSIEYRVSTSAADHAPALAAEARATTGSEQPQTTTADRHSAVGHQVLEFARSSLSRQTADKEITIHLNPPELGKVSVKFQEQGAEITGTLEVSKPQTRAEIEQALPEIIRSLADSGVAIKRLEVVLSQNEQSSGQTSRDPLLQDGFFQQQNSPHRGSYGDDQHSPQTYYGPAARGRYHTAAQVYEMLVTNTSINMLA